MASVKSRLGGSNPGPAAYEAAATATELSRHGAEHTTGRAEFVARLGEMGISAAYARAADSMLHEVARAVAEGRCRQCDARSYLRTLARQLVMTSRKAAA